MQIAVTNLTAQVKQAEPHEWEWLDGYLTFEREVFRKDKAGRMAHGMEEEKLLEHNGRFPAGMLSSVIPAAERADPPVTIEVVSSPVAPMEPDAAADVSWLRDYQREGFDRALALHRGILWMPTGSGKTEIAAALMRAVRCRWLFLAHRTQLAVQAGERFTLRTGEPFGVCADGRWEPQRVTVATFQTLATALSGRSGVEAQVQARAVLAGVQGVIADECHTCFSAGTIVDGKRIEELKVGERVRAFDTDKRKFVWSRITHTHKRVPLALVRVSFSDGSAVVCTPDHRFFTQCSGWVHAIALEPAHLLQCAQEVRNGQSVYTVRCLQDRSAALLQAGAGHTLPSAPWGKGGKAKKGRAAYLRRVQHTHRDKRAVGARTVQTRRGGVLLRPMQGAGARSKKVCAQFAGCYSERSSDLRTHESKQPYGQGKHTQQVIAGLESHGTQANDARRQRPWGNGPTTAAVGSAGGAEVRSRSGVCDTDQAGEGQRLSDFVQGGHSNPKHTAVRGSRRRKSRGGSAPSAGRQKDSISGVARVVRVEVLKPGSDGRYGGLCPDGYVYDVTVAGVHTFCIGAAGIVVHNCAADTAALVLRALPNAYWRIGLSGTPLQRTDKRSGIAVGYLDRPIYRITTERLVAAGALAPPTIRMVRCLQAVNKPTYQGFYSDAVVNSKDRNRIVVGLAASRPTPSLVFVRQTKHGIVLKRILDRSGVDVRYVDGAAPLAARLAAVKWLEDRTQKRVLITTTIMQEGVDIPALETVIYASGGESPIAVLQSLGRGSRTDGGRKTSFEFWDVYDEAPRMSDDAVGKSWAADHAKNRAKAYAAEWGTVYVGPSIDGPWAELARPKEKK